MITTGSVVLPSLDVSVKVSVMTSPALSWFKALLAVYVHAPLAVAVKVP